MGDLTVGRIALSEETVLRRRIAELTEELGMARAGGVGRLGKLLELWAQLSRDEQRELLTALGAQVAARRR